MQTVLQKADVHKEINIGCTLNVTAARQPTNGLPDKVDLRNDMKEYDYEDALAPTVPLVEYVSP